MTQLTEEQVELGKALDFACTGATLDDMIARRPALPGDDERLLPPALRAKYDKYLEAVAIKTLRG